ncbi:Spore germination protein B1 [Paenibacillus allorhizoplanae]|uniref:Spore germination protein B1 n=1 Tax=Paenibacillus allorhizoplanae TaxID=2905648 RepID=A0ABN8G7L7_9BACL|nr:spore germination protein [Paenibacillus allorhizoplanae]CAH1202177.1 Spore germination protein B1 [Paenibacillus allorhizoplanae]
MKSSSSVQNTYQHLKEAVSSSTDFVMKVMSFDHCEIRLFYLETMIDTTVFQDHVVRPLSLRPDLDISDVVTVRIINKVEDLHAAVEGIIEGKTIVQKEGFSTLYILGTELKKERAVNIPMNERVLRGPHEAFIENLDTNINMLRKNMVSSELVVKYFTIGNVSKTRVAVVYMNGIANPEVVSQIEQRFQKIDLDYIDAPGVIEEYIADRRLSLFPQMLVTERVDRSRSNLMEGKVSILVEGSPTVTIMPVSFWAFFQSPDDYQINWWIGSAFRLLRIACFFIGLGLPGVYVSLVSFQPYVLPLNVALTLQGALKYITLLPAFEVIMMLFALEILREATIRLANPIGQAIGVVGGIVIGTAVVQSNLVSNTAVIVASITGLASFIIPSYEMSSSVRLLNYPVIGISSVFGLVGFVFSFFCLLIYLCRMNSMGLPYFYPSLVDRDVKDTLIRAPFWQLKKRPKDAAPVKSQRMRNPRR